MRSHRCVFNKIPTLCAFLYSFLTFCIHIGAFSLKIVLLLHFENIFFYFLCPHLCVFIKIHSLCAFHDFVLLFAITFLTHSMHIGTFPMKFIHCMFLPCNSILAKFFFRAYSFFWALESHLSIIWMYLVYFKNRVSAFLNFKITIYLWLSHDMKHCTFNLQSFLSWLSQRQIAFLEPLEWRNHFDHKSKIV